ncbi:uncharacterized protein LOC120945004 [Rana temporaria]|uniref:uncharacterized protein LOC120945004 n=1 Tax=Rana temporaria TaxID=8407 RepID=UPI001AACCB7E|nr:uncharacterized protein LOC120945004 [Rana temporaria]
MFSVSGVGPVSGGHVVSRVVLSSPWGHSVLCLWSPTSLQGHSVLWGHAVLCLWDHAVSEVMFSVSGVGPVSGGHVVSRVVLSSVPGVTVCSASGVRPLSRAILFSGVMLSSGVRLSPGSWCPPSFGVRLSSVSGGQAVSRIVMSSVYGVRLSPGSWCPPSLGSGCLQDHGVLYFWGQAVSRIMVSSIPGIRLSLRSGCLLDRDVLHLWGHTVLSLPGATLTSVSGVMLSPRLRCPFLFFYLSSQCYLSRFTVNVITCQSLFYNKVISVFYPPCFFSLSAHLGHLFLTHIICYCGWSVIQYYFTDTFYCILLLFYFTYVFSPVIPTAPP